MATRSYRPSENWHIADGTEVLEKHAHDISVGQLIPRIVERNKRAIKTIPTRLNFFQAIRAGRRCSCFDIEESPDSMCPACFGTGTVGGFTKHGSCLEIIDVTHPNLCTINVIPDHSKRTKPISLALIGGCKQGSLEVKIELPTNVGKVDALSSAAYMPAGTELHAYLRAPNEKEFVALTRANLEMRLANPWVDIRVDFSRSSPENESPRLDLLYIRYQNIQDNLILANIPRAEKSNLLQELGVADEWQTMNFWLDNTLKSITTEDFIVSTEGKTRWKIISVKEFAPHGQLTSWDVEARLVQHYEAYAKVPL